ncbi:MAG: four-helix bundle copper-binding protein [Planctomycetia bacterium]|nr:four-helix bundle copper-binding protein [Planctomycetia bacterium]
MSHIKFFAILGLMTGAFAIVGLYAPAGEKPAPPDEVPIHPVDPKMTQFLDCSKACDDCARFCDLCAGHCARLVADGKKEHLETLKTCQDCATICSAASRVVAKFGPFSDLICIACADACKRCGDACEKFPNDPMMKKCAEECRKCEKACREMIKQAKTITPPEKPEK